MKRILKWAGAVLLLPLLLVALTALLLYLPPVQRWALDRLTTYAEEQSGMQITASRVALSFPLRLTFDGVVVERPNALPPPPTDTLVDVRHASVNVGVWPLLKGRIAVDGLTLEDGRVNTLDMIPSVQISGRVGRLAASSRGIDLGRQAVPVDRLSLDDSDLAIRLVDTADEDTTSSAPWVVTIDKADVSRSSVALLMGGDSVRVAARVEQLSVSDALVNTSGTYSIGHIDLKGGTIGYDDDASAPTADGLDYHHLALTDVSLRADSLSYSADGMRAKVAEAALKERSGLTVEQLRGDVLWAGGRLKVAGLSLKTSESVVSTDLDIDLDHWMSQGGTGGDVKFNGHALLSKRDIARLLPDLPAALLREWPDEPLSLDGDVEGNADHVDIRRLKAVLPSAFDLSVSGYANHWTDSLRRQAHADVSGVTRNMRFATAILDSDTRRAVRIPYGTGLKGTVDVEGPACQTNLTLSQGAGRVRVNGRYDLSTDAYAAHVAAHQFPLQRFLPASGLTPLTARADISGRGTDLYAPSTTLTLDADASQLGLDSLHLDGMAAHATLRGGRLAAQLDSQSPLFNGLVAFDGTPRRNQLRGTLTCDIRQMDLQRLHVTDSALVVALCGNVDVDTDMKDSWHLHGALGDLRLKSATDDYRPDDITFNLLTRTDTTALQLSTGDLHLAAQARGGYAMLIEQGDSLMAEGQRQWQSRRIDQTRLRERFPDMHLQLTAGRGNLLHHLLATTDYSFARVEGDLLSSATDGLNGFLNVDTLHAAGVQLDDIRCRVASEADVISYHAKVQNGRNNPQYTFRADIDGALTEKGSDITAKLYDADGALGIDMGMAATLEEGGVRFTLTDDTPVIGFVPFNANKDNYIYLSDDRRLSADVVLKAADGTGVQIYSNDDNEDVLQDITLALNGMNLQRIFSVIPYTPDISGLMNGDFHIVQTADQMSVSSTLAVDALAYEQSPIGNLSSEFVYMPKDDGSHYVDGLLFKDGSEIGSISGSYHADTGFDAMLNLTAMPLDIVNGFVPDHVVGLSGTAEGELALHGTAGSPVIDGEVLFSQSSLFSTPYGITLRFTEDPVRIDHSRFVFENFELYANNDSPLNVIGYYDFSDLSHMKMDIRMQAHDFLLIDAKENPRSEAFGKAYVNFYGSMGGPVDNLTMRGKLDVLGTTNLSYIMRDSELTTDTQLDDLVTFTNFEDTVTVVTVERPPLTGFTMDLSVSVDETAHVFCALNTDKTNYLDIDGGGDLRLRYTPDGELTMTGRYTVDAGKMKYSLPVIPLKTFNITQGSYVEFTGDVYNPTLHITATENVKATVGEGETSGRPVDFVCGVKLSQTLNNLGLAFVIDAPTDNAVRDELNAMSEEDRGKIAITMLASGMYLADGNTSGFTMNAALSSFLQSEINNIAGSAMRSMGLDLSMGVDNAVSTTGQMHTDYNFKFSKRLWNNRLNFIVGGKVSTGSDVESRDESFFDNVELEYRINQNASQYLRLFYDNNTYDWLEGMIGEYGAGFMWRRKLQHFRDIFRFKNPQQPTVAPRQPAADTQQPGADAPKAAADTQQPEAAARQPEVKTEEIAHEDSTDDSN